jgi:hypothetical protein
MRPIAAARCTGVAALVGLLVSTGCTETRTADGGSAASTTVADISSVTLPPEEAAKLSELTSRFEDAKRDSDYCVAIEVFTTHQPTDRKSQNLVDFYAALSEGVAEMNTGVPGSLAKHWSVLADALAVIAEAIRTSGGDRNAPEIKAATTTKEFEAARSGLELWFRENCPSGPSPNADPVPDPETSPEVNSTTPA